MVTLWSCKGKGEKDRKTETLFGAHAIFFFMIYEKKKTQRCKGILRNKEVLTRNNLSN